MSKLSVNPKLATLGVVGVIVSVAVLAVNFAPPAMAQTESYITDAEEAASCEGVCNTFVPPQDEDECRALASEHWADEYEYNLSRLTRIQTLYNDALEVAANIRLDERAAAGAVRLERINAAKAVAATAIVAAKAKFTKCIIAASALPYPASGAATAECLTWHALAMTELSRPTKPRSQTFGVIGKNLRL